MPDQVENVPEPKEIRSLTVEQELHTCPDCGYDLGFHTSFERTGTGKISPVRSTREVYRVILICPECGARFDIGWRVPLAESESRIVKAPAGTCVPHGNPADCLPPRTHHDHYPPE
ncbi:MULTISPECIES: hypothetical protein [unclassified Methanoregula]|uniref:hypothetical protein n=1 Tax=unclassified Methanoregula TaxID=2649730 RepID=UPI0009D1CB37|nr:MULTISPECIES: hypothetical protein [unclassified Methanoregula]OPX62300.1 MAG: hypothetical protein A4E33_02370 [Methanoregula sp. PtaB.Bin085]OPY32727.1 MAG: hypothetical protein A4E34_02104 [Methanoregula sp. PtaU1.Bin006]